MTQHPKKTIPHGAEALLRRGLLWPWLLLAVLATLAACSKPPLDDVGRKAKVESLYAGYRTDFPKVAEISAAQAVALARQGELLPIDVREPAERAVSTLPGAITAKEYLADPGRFAGKKAVAYCTIGYRSGMWAAAQASQGLPVANLAGGLLAWLHAGGTLVDAKGQPTKTVHVYGRTWDLAPSGYVAVW